MDEPLYDLLSHFSVLDGLAFLLLMSVWVGSTLAIEHSGGQRPSMHVLMTGYSEKWMQQMITREPRVFDSNILGMLRQGTMFFASGSMLAIGGCVFTIAAFAWLIDAVPLIIATLLTVWVIYRREFASKSRKELAGVITFCRLLKGVKQ